MKKLINKYVLVTGAAGGIGQAVSELFASLGTNLILVDINEVELEKLTKRLSAQFKNLSIKQYKVDITDKKEIANLVEAVKSLDVLINNAGVAFGGSFIKSDAEEINKALSVNLIGTVNLTHALLPLLSESGDAQIVNVASGAGLVGTSGMVTYSSTKFGLVGFTEALRGELKDENIGVSVVCPAFVKTNLIANSVQGNNHNLQNLEAMVKKQGVTPEVVAKSILKAAKTNKAIIKVGSLTKTGYLIKRIAPSLARYINVVNYRKLKKNEIIE